jgi:hypothetical protein
MVARNTSKCNFKLGVVFPSPTVIKLRNAQKALNVNRICAKISPNDTNGLYGQKFVYVTKQNIAFTGAIFKKLT